MAWDFTKNDLQACTLLVSTSPDPKGTAQFVSDVSIDSEMVNLFQAIADAYDVGTIGTVQSMNELVIELRRVADTDAEISIERIDENADGSSTTFLAKGKVLI